MFLLFETDASGWHGPLTFIPYKIIPLNLYKGNPKNLAERILNCLNSSSLTCFWCTSFKNLPENECKWVNKKTLRVLWGPRVLQGGKVSSCTFQCFSLRSWTCQNLSLWDPLQTKSFKLPLIEIVKLLLSPKLGIKV